MSEDSSLVQEAFPSYTEDPIKFEAATTTLKDEVLYIVENAIPTVVTFSFQFTFQVMAPIYFAGQHGDQYLAASSLSMAIFWITGPVIVNGFSTAMDTMCSTAYGAGSYDKVGLYYKKCVTILILAFIPMSFFWLNSAPVIRLTTDDEDMVALCDLYLKLMPFLAIPMVVFECSKKFLQSQNKFNVPTRIMLLGLPITFALNHFLFDIGFLAPPISLILGYWIITALILGYICFIDGYQCWNPNTTMQQLFSDWAPFFDLGVPGVLMIMSEAFAFRIITFLSARFGPLAIEAQTIVTTVASLSYQLPFSVGICCSTRIANYIGARSGNYKMALKCAIGAGWVLSFFNLAWMSLLRYPIAKIFARDEKLIELSARLFIVVAINQFLDSINIICAALLRSQGRQNVGSVLSLLCYYVVATPIGVVAAFPFGLQVYGLWFGLAIGVGILSIAELMLVLKTDWMAILKKSTNIV
ncbi:hypothetical protein OGAPHI_001370 [Ogataea philodendri]|uniref:Uncharacterized protein n=1 Tax=Ogataea philodendri TaxID=1378263 RepID=A0A9P8PD37_9ASCO|nr:uncharacterized protein OGAPHI_001370 [Ogataea philodendri]KAH3669249.1 hypothetical protein OGAPHI_001370 [Ogataea philodendri]